MGNKVTSITKKSQNISDWYNDVILNAGLAEHAPARGTMIIKPYGFAIWEEIQRIMDPKIKSLGAQNVYFPLFIPYSFLQKEKSHVEGFSPELAVVTHGGGEDLVEPLVVRPTSETIMYDAFSRWIQSFRDLPLTINQWTNVVRWEKRPYLFLRTTEFLWQEGHSAHQNHSESQEMVKKALDMYIDFYQNTLCIWGYAGKKSETEKFAGADETFTYEILAPDGKVIQGCTSHDLGQNFAEVFDIQFLNSQGKQEYVWQNSWGLSTRSIGAMILVHGDDNGLVLPPKVAPTQVIIIPIESKDSDNQKINDLTQKVYQHLETRNIRVKIDRTDQSPGWKFNQYDLQGIPVRVDIGSKEAETNKLRVKIRDNGEFVYPSVEEVAEVVEKIFNEMNQRLLEETKQRTLANTHEVNTYQEFKDIMAAKRGFISAYWCESSECEARIKEETKASTRCLPLDAKHEDNKCVFCGSLATHRWIFGQSY